MELKCANCENRDDKGFCETITEALRLDPRILAHGLATIQMPDNGGCNLFEPSDVAIGEDAEALAEQRDLNWDRQADQARAERDDRAA
jgi:hypothetical protein